MAGVPMVMRAMLQAIEPELPRGVPVKSVTVEAAIPEGTIALGLSALQNAHKDVAIGSYPFYREGQVQPFGAQLVLRGRDSDAVERAAEALEALLRELGVVPQRVP
jgi:molybdopterin-biosynthesis enzyme MoeA-like protein